MKGKMERVRNHISFYETYVHLNLCKYKIVYTKLYYYIIKVCLYLIVLTDL